MHTSEVMCMDAWNSQTRERMAAPALRDPEASHVPRDVRLRARR